jgi:hypothetical protein
LFSPIALDPSVPLALRSSRVACKPQPQSRHQARTILPPAIFASVIALTFQIHFGVTQAHEQLPRVRIAHRSNGPLPEPLPSAVSLPYHRFSFFRSIELDIPMCLHFLGEVFCILIQAMRLHHVYQLSGQDFIN